MTVTDSARALEDVAGQRRAAGIYGAIITAAIIAAVGDHRGTVPLAIAVLVTLVVYWAAEAYAELLGQHSEGGKLPSWPYIRATLAARWPMVSASYVPLLALVIARLAGASDTAAQNTGLGVAVALLILHSWSMGRAAKLRGWQLAIATSIAALLGLLMVVLKNLILVYLH